MAAIHAGESGEKTWRESACAGRARQNKNKKKRAGRIDRVTTYLQL
jgi:hypothetical protein